MGIEAKTGVYIEIDAHGSTQLGNDSGLDESMLEYLVRKWDIFYESIGPIITDTCIVDRVGDQVRIFIETDDPNDETISTFFDNYLSQLPGHAHLRAVHGEFLLEETSTPAYKSTIIAGPTYERLRKAEYQANEVYAARIRVGDLLYNKTIQKPRFVLDTTMFTSLQKFSPEFKEKMQERSVEFFAGTPRPYVMIPHLFTGARVSDIEYEQYFFGRKFQNLKRRSSLPESSDDGNIVNYSPEGSYFAFIRLAEAPSVTTMDDAQKYSALCKRMRKSIEEYGPLEKCIMDMTNDEFVLEIAAKNTSEGASHVLEQIALLQEHLSGTMGINTAISVDYGHYQRKTIPSLEHMPQAYVGPVINRAARMSYGIGPHGAGNTIITNKRVANALEKPILEQYCMDEGFKRFNGTRLSWVRYSNPSQS